MNTNKTPPIELSPEHLGQLDPRIRVPRYARDALGDGIVHFGVGGFHRSHQAEYLDDLCNEGCRDWSITGVGVLPGDSLMADALEPQRGLYTLVTRSQHEEQVRVIGSLVRYLHAYPDLTALTDILASASTRLVSLTITEGGYPLTEEGPPSLVFEAMVDALAQRRAEGIAPFTVMSCDNILHNGTVARRATQLVAGSRSAALADWIGEEVAFPNSMVDRITPVTEEADRAHLKAEYGLADRWPVVAEPFRQWVIEDDFAQGRPPWEDAGALITSDVTPYELLKLRLLNAGHSTIAYLAALAGYDLVDRVVKDEDFSLYLQRFLDEEASPVLPPVSGVDVDEYKRTLVERFSNPAIRDQVSRLCLDGSSKFPVFLIPTIAAQIAASGPTRLAALALAGWCQYLLGTDDEGRDLPIAADPGLEVSASYARASVSDPAAFLEHGDVFPDDVARHTGFRAEFTEALGSLRAKGAQATVAAWVRSGPT